ncbi:MAG: LppX_LprAFG lipoprotein [Anaerolineales bacterium]|nr:LppX_LprAFG lipoprotein [Anaerolineales bacterium]
MSIKTNPVLRLCLVVVFVTLLLGVACSRATPETLAPEEIISRSIDRMKALSGFHFVIDRSGSPAFLDAESLLAFRRAEGDYVSPDRAQATIRVIAPGIVAEVSIVSIGETHWETNLFTGEWEKLPPNWGFNPASLFDQDYGIQPILESDLHALEYTGLEKLEEIPGLKFYALSGKVAGEKLYQLSFEMIGPEVMDVRLWIEPETFDLHRMVVIDPQPGESEPTIWQLDFWNFDEAVEIVPPVLVEGES